MTQQRWWLVLAAVMAVSAAILAAVGDGLAFAAALMCGVALLQAQDDP